MKLKQNTVSPSLIEAGFYYEKGNNPGWLRRVIDFSGHEGRVRYVDFAGVGQCDISSLSRWARRRLTHEEAMVEFPTGNRVLRCIGDLARAGGANDYRIDQDIPRRDPRTGW
jgi:hypothetical protein